MDPKSLASEIIHAGAGKVLDKNPKRVDDAVANTVIKQGANALESGVSKGKVDPALGAAAEVHISVSYTSTCMGKSRHCAVVALSVVFSQCLGVWSHTKRGIDFKISINSSALAATCTDAQACHHLQGVRHSKPTEVVDEVKAQLKQKVQPAGNPLADVIVAAGKDKLSKKPEDKQNNLTSEQHTLACSLLTCYMMEFCHQDLYSDKSTKPAAYIYFAYVC